VTKQYKGVSYPNKKFQTEQWGQNLYSRQFLYDFNQAGFDVLIVDHRGVGISGGVNFWDNSESAEDIFRMLDQLEVGTGLTVLTPTGQLLQGKETAGLVTWDAGQTGFGADWRPLPWINYHMLCNAKKLYRLGGL
jgi:pimeloyl-ACP methyl ester carboxylesterase